VLRDTQSDLRRKAQVLQSDLNALMDKIRF
jgi:hypothetical protein